MQHSDNVDAVLYEIMGEERNNEMVSEAGISD